MVAELSAGSLRSIKTEHTHWWRRFWSASYIEIPDKVVETFWYGSQYILASCNRPGKIVGISI